MICLRTNLAPPATCVRSSPKNGELVFAKNADDAALNADFASVHYDGRHLGVGGLQANLAARLAEEALQSGVAVTYQGYDDLAGIYDLSLLDDDVVAIENVVVAHGFAADLKDEIILAASEVGEGKRFAIFDCFDGVASGDAAHKRKIGGAAGSKLIAYGLGELADFDGAALIVAAANETLLLEGGKMFVNSGKRGEFESVANFLEAGRVATLIDEIDEVVEDFFLTLGQGHSQSFAFRFVSGFAFWSPVDNLWRIQGESQACNLTMRGLELRASVPPGSGAVRGRR